MRKADLIRLRDLRDAYRLIGECRDVGRDPALWHIRMFSGLRDLIGAAVAVGGEGFWDRPLRPIQPISSFDVGLDADGRRRLLAHAHEIGAQGHPMIRALEHVPGQILTRTRSAIVTDALWYRSPDFNDYLRPSGLDHTLFSVCRVSNHGAISAIMLVRGSAERDFSAGEVRLLEFFHEELGRLVGRQLVSATEPEPGKLSPRLHQTLCCLVEGDSEKQVAARLGLSPTTVHQYVTALYRRFGVQSRGQLIAHILRRSDG